MSKELKVCATDGKHALVAFQIAGEVAVPVERLKNTRCGR